MKIVYLFLLILLAFPSKGQHGYVIKGKIGNTRSGAAVELTRWYGNMGEIIAVDTIQEGNFLLEGEVDEVPARMTLNVIGDSTYYGERTMWIGEDITKINGNNLCVSLWKVKNNQSLQAEENQFVKKTAAVEEAYAKFWQEKERAYWRELSDQRKKVPVMTDYPIQRIVDSLVWMRMQANLRILEKCTVLTKVGMERLYPLAREIHYTKQSRLNREVLRNLFLRLDSDLKNSARATEIQNYLYPIQVVEIGDEMADGTLFDLEGNEHRLSDYKGKYILLDFWSSACGPCVMAHPELNEVTEKYRDNLHVISISLDGSKKIWKEASEKIVGINLSDLKGEGGIVSKYGFDGIPKFVIINPQGIIVDKWTGYAKGELKNKFAEYLAK